MAFEGIRNYLYNVIRYFGIGIANDELPRVNFTRKSPSVAESYATIGPEGSSVDPPASFADSESIRDGTGFEVGPGIKDNNKPPQLLKASLCAHSISHDFAGTNGANKDGGSDEGGAENDRGTTDELSLRDGQVCGEPSERKSENGEDKICLSVSTCPTPELRNESEEIQSHPEKTSSAYLERLIQLKREAEKHLRPAPSTYFRGDAETDDHTGDRCALYRICPQLAPGSAAAVVRPKQAQKLRGRVAFNSPLFSEGDFELRIVHDQVCLEFVLISEVEIHGYVRVLNTTYVKHVTIDYTENNWKEVSKASAEWVETVDEGRMDRFEFVIPGRSSPGEIRFSLRFNGALDDNKGRTYTVAYEHECQ